MISVNGKRVFSVLRRAGEPDAGSLWQEVGEELAADGVGTSPVTSCCALVDPRPARRLVCAAVPPHGPGRGRGGAWRGLAALCPGLCG